MVAFSEKFMKKNIFLLLTAVFVLFISACGADDEGEFIAGKSCSSEGAEICSDDGIELLLCQDSAWTLKKQCNISIGKRCRQNADGVFGCFGEGETGVSDSGTNTDDTGTDSGNSENSTEEPDTGSTPDTETENPDNESNSENTGDSDTTPQTDSEQGDPDDTEISDEDSGDIPENDNEPDTPEPPSDQCSSNSDCSDPAAPYCSISTSKCIANAVFITEYVEGSSNNKAIEIYNGSKSAVNLSNFTIQQANNGNDWGSNPTSFVFNFPAASISSGQTFVFCNVAADNELIAKCDQTPTSAVFQFNGDDGIALFDGTTIVDQIGNAMEQTKWSVAGVSSATQDHTLRRKISVIQGTTDWAASAGTTESDSQWEVFPQDTFDGLKIR